MPAGLGSPGSGSPGLTAAQERAFDARARRLGHDPGRLRGPAEQVSYPVVPSVAALRALLAATPAQRRRRQAVFFGPSVAIRASLGQGIHDRLEAAAWADGRIDPRDEQWASRHFPFPTRILSIRYRPVRADQAWDLSVRGEHWGLDDRDDILSVVNVGHLHLAPGALVTVRGNLLVLTIHRLTCDDAAGEPVPVPPGAGAAGPCRLAILPAPFPVDAGTGPLHGAGGRAGRDGTRGPDGAPAAVTSTWLGPRLDGPVDPAARDGAGGAPAGRGGDGGKGRAGGASKTAEITIGQLDGSLTLLAMAGRGGDGGAAGGGGRGGDGGDGAPAQRTLLGPLPPGRGGQGGNGGDGGRGGNAGPGGIASNIFVSLPPPDAPRLRVLSYPAAGGRGGPGGQGGHAGRGGQGDGEAGRRDGADGAAGPPGRDGRQRPAPPVHVNEVPAGPRPAPAQDQVPAPGPVRSRDIRRGLPPAPPAPAPPSCPVAPTQEERGHDIDQQA